MEENGALLLRRKVGESIDAEGLEIEVKCIDKPFARIGLRIHYTTGKKDYWVYQGKPLIVEGIITIQVAELQHDRVQLRMQAPKSLRIMRKELLAARY